jgi:hypothetical protein
MWFIYGAIIGCLQLAWSIWRYPVPVNYPLQGFVVSALAGAAIYGSLLWLANHYVLHL